MKDDAFTLIELVIVITILAILAAVAIPIFQNLQTSARNAATKGAVGAIRQAISQYRANEIANGRSDGSGSGGAAGWPSTGQVMDWHCIGYNSSLPHVMELADLPPNPWASVTTYVTVGQGDCVGAAGPFTPKGIVTTTVNAGWRYKQFDGQFWANSAENDGTPSFDLENNCAADPSTENCF